MAGLFGLDAYEPSEIAVRVQEVGVKKARLPVLSTLTLGVLAGGFVSLGALYYTLVASDASLSFAASRVLGGVVFSLGYILVVVAGAEVFTGNILLVMAWASRKITHKELWRNWVTVYAGNFIGAFGLALLVVLSRQWTMNGGLVAEQAVYIAAMKTSYPFWEAFFRGILCNIFIALAVWASMAGRTVTDRVLAIIFPISAFVALGFEQSIANMYFIPIGILLQGSVGPLAEGVAANLNWLGFLRNLVPVTLGNIVGGGVMVALVDHFIYHRMGRPPGADPQPGAKTDEARSEPEGKAV